MNPRLLVVSLIALAAHTAAPAKTVKPLPVTVDRSQPDAEAVRATVSYADLDLRSDAGAKALRQRLDRTVVALSGGFDARTRPAVLAARARAQAQADAIIAAARA